MLHEELIEHFKYPHNRKRITDPTFTTESYNPSCGDRVIMDGIVTNRVLTDVGFNASGCVISQATASILTEYCKGKQITDVLSLTKDDILGMVNIPLGPTRLKCALISLEVLQKGILETK